MVHERPPAVAGRFYPADAKSCRRMLEQFFRDIEAPAAQGAIVPHAGWSYSGATAALSFRAIAGFQPDTVVLFGAVHGPDPNFASVYGAGAWRTPLGSVEVDAELASRFTRHGLLVDAPAQHQFEHAIEVQLPFIQWCLPNARIVPVSVRPTEHAVEIGRACATEAKEHGGRVAFVGSTDLTHYGPAFGFEPEGTGLQGVRWARDVNDRRLIGLIADLKAEGVVAEATERRNACGPGAVAATIAAMRELGATRYQELRHVHSAEVQGGPKGKVEHSVGYEAGVFLPE